MVELKLDGAVIAAETPEKLAELAQKLGLEFSRNGWYYSESYGGRWLKIKDMNPNHVANAVLKIHQDSLDKARAFAKEGRYGQMLKELKAGPESPFLPELTAALQSK